MVNVDHDRLIDACSDDGQDSGITTRALLEPLAGPGEPVKPAVYGGGRYQVDRRWWDDEQGRRPVEAIVIDNVASQANRLEAALESLRPRLGIPELVLDLEAVSGLPPHLPKRLSSFRFPHRQADAYLRDAALDGIAFHRSEIGERLFAATADQAEPLLEWFPQALLFGFWQSHLGKKRTQAKLARSWISETVGYIPAWTEPVVRQLGYKGDPLSLTIDEPVLYDENDRLAGWELVTGGKKAGQGKSKDSLAEIGHGQVPAEGAAAVGFQTIEQRATVSFASLRRIRMGSTDADAAARALLAALGLVAHAAGVMRHGDLWAGNLLVERGRLVGMVDWGRLASGRIPGRRPAPALRHGRADPGRKGAGRGMAGSALARPRIPRGNPRLLAVPGDQPHGRDTGAGGDRLVGLGGGRKPHPAPSSSRGPALGER